jgi:ribosomal protein S18 acetylase RimI-like enzyme
VTIPIRPAVPSDAPSIAAVHVAASRDAYVGLMPDDAPAQFNLEFRTSMWTEVLCAAHPPGNQRLLVAEDHAGNVIGFGSCGVQRTPTLAGAGFDAEIWCIYVLPEHQRRGVGRALMRKMADDLRSRGMRGMALWVLQQNVPATRFYEKFGGSIVADKEERVGAAVLNEVAYGWRHLSRLQDATA